MDLAERLLHRIRDEGIRPVPRRVVILRRLGWGALFLVVLAMLSLSFALLVQELHAHAGPGWMLRTLLSRAAPWVWTATTLLFAFLAYRVFRELPRAWRLRPLGVVLAILLTGMLAGVALEASDALLGLHRLAAHSVPVYRKVWMDRALRTWQSPSEGRLAGRFVGGHAAFEDVDGRLWTLRWNADTADLPPGRVRLRGTVENVGSFRVDACLPAPGAGRGRGMEFRGMR